MEDPKCVCGTLLQIQNQLQSQIDLLRKQVEMIAQHTGQFKVDINTEDRWGTMMIPLSQTDEWKALAEKK